MSYPYCYPDHSDEKEPLPHYRAKATPLNRDDPGSQFTRPECCKNSSSVWTDAPCAV
jgi:hypothetical protein